MPSRTRNASRPGSGPRRSGRPGSRAGGELDEEATTEDYSVVQSEGSRSVRRRVRKYSLDAVISVGYRVNSLRGQQFRIWATRTLRGHVLRGYTLNACRLAERSLGEIEDAVGLLAQVSLDHPPLPTFVRADAHKAAGFAEFPHSPIDPTLRPREETGRVGDRHLWLLPEELEQGLRCFHWRFH